MLNPYRLFRAAVTLACVVLVTGCASSPPRELTNPDGILSYVPANTPYVLAFVEPLPDELLDNIEPKADRALQGYQAFFREVFRSAMAENSKDMNVAEMQQMSALIDELIGLVSIQGMRDAGFERDSRFVVFGHGLLPVLRMQIDDVTKFEATIARFEEAAGHSMDTSDIDGVSYRHVGDESLKLVIGIFAGDAVITAIPGNFGDNELRQLTGLARPAESLVAAGTLEAIAAGYGMTDNMVGYIDIEAIATTFVDGPTGLDALMLAGKEGGEDGAREELSEVCKQEILGMAGVAPRIVFGYTAVERDRTASVAVIELREDIAAGMSGFAAAVPGLGSDPGGLLSFGMSFNLLAMRNFVEARLDALDMDPYRCERFDKLQQSTAELRASLAQPVPPFVYGLRGFNLILDDITGLDFESDAPPESVDGSVLLAMDDAPTMFAMGAMMNPMLAALNLQPDGVPAELTIPQLAVITDSAHAALTDDALVMSLGGESESRVLEVLTAPTKQPPPIVSMSADAAWYYELMAQSMLTEESGEVEDPLPEAAREAMADALRAIGDMYERIYFDVRFTQRGIEMFGDVTIATD